MKLGRISKGGSLSRAPIRRLAGCAVACLMGFQIGLARADTVDPAAPTSDHTSPEVREQQWRAAQSKYDAKRHEWLDRVTAEESSGPFRPDWSSLRQYRAPAWYANARFGIFIHWGLYSVAGFGNEWYSRNMYREGTPEYRHHRETYGPQERFGYKDLIPLFKVDKFDPRAWAKLFREAGARYVVPVAEHHDGFAMYDSELSDWTAAKMGPRRDLLGELRSAVLSEGLHFGLSSHRAEHDWFFDVGRHIRSDVNDPAYAAFYGPAQERLSPRTDSPLVDDFTYVGQGWTHDWLARTTELVTKYQPELVYFDWWVGQASFRDTVPEFLAYYYNRGVATGGVVVNYKEVAFAPGAGTLDIERGQLSGIRSRSGKRTPRSATPPGDLSSTIRSRHRNSSSTCWPMWYRRTATFCSMSGRNLMARYPKRRSGFCARWGPG